MPDHTTDETTRTEAAAGPRQPRLPRRLVFKPPMISLVVLAFLVVCESTVALALPYFWLLYLIPLGGAVWVLRTRTVVDAQTVVVRRVFTRKALPWSGIASLRLRDRRWVAAVLTDESEVVLPEVRARHIPVLALITGGRIADPFEAAEKAAAEKAAAEQDATHTDEASQEAEKAEEAPAATGEAADAPVSKQERDQPV